MTKLVVALTLATFLAVTGAAVAKDIKIVLIYGKTGPLEAGRFYQRAFNVTNERHPGILAVDRVLRN